MRISLLQISLLQSLKTFQINLANAKIAPKRPKKKWISHNWRYEINWPKIAIAIAILAYANLGFCEFFPVRKVAGVKDPLFFHLGRKVGHNYNLPHVKNVLLRNICCLLKNYLFYKHSFN